MVSPAPPAAAPARDHYLLIPHPAGPRLLLRPGPAGWTLPHFRTPEAELFDGRLIRRRARAELGLDATVLRVVAASGDPATWSWRWAIFALESHDPGWTPPPDARWVDDAELAALPLAHAAQRPTLAAWLAEQAGGVIPAARPPWARPGWLARATRWVEAALAARGRALTGPLEQCKTWSISCLLRGSTAAGDVYLKACPRLPLFTHEPAVTAALARLFPSCVPAPLAVEAAERWMLLADFGGADLEGHPLADWEAAVRLYARMQREAVDRVDALLAAGCLDRRPAVLAAGIGPLVDASAALGAFAADEIARLRAAAPRLAALCAALDAGGVPATLLHGDFHDKNIAVRADGPLFYDWSDACIAHPFLDLATLLDFSNLAQEAGVRERLWAVYLAEWAGVAPEAALATAAALAGPLGWLHQAISYQHIVLGAEPGAQWELRDGWTTGVRRVLAALDALPDAEGGG